MFSKRTKKALALTLSLGVVANSVGLINSPVVAYAEDAGVSSSEGDGQSSNNEESDNFKAADGELTQSIDDYIDISESPEDISIDNISSIINEFSYESNVTTGSAITIEAKDIVNFENDGSIVSFNGTLYEDKEGGATYGFNYSNTYNQPLMLTSNLLTSENTSEWSTTEDITTASDKTVIINGVKFTLNADGSTVSVSGYNSVDINTYLSEQSGLIKLPNIISYGENNYSVTSIGEESFKDCSGLESVEIPKSVTSIEAKSFKACSGLESIKIPSSVERIWNGAFNNCRKLDNVKIPSSVTSIGQYVFMGCISLKSIEMTSGVTSIPDFTFNGCSSLESIKIPETIESIGNYVFENCTKLENIEIPPSVTSIAWNENYAINAFKGCSSLKSISIPESVTKMGDNEFEECQENLTAFFYKVSDDKSGAEITRIYEKNGKKYIGSDVTIPDTIYGIKVTSIGKDAFLDCASLKSIVIPSSVTSVEDAFSGCSNLESITCYDAKIKDQIEKTPGINATVKASMSNYSINGDTNAIYDKKPHSIIVKGAPSGTTITYSATTGSAVQYTAVNPEYTEKGSHTVYYKVSGGGYFDEITGSAELNIVENPVQSIVISCEGGVNAISTKGGSLKLTGAVSPSDAGIPALKWTIVSGQDIANISEDGVLTAKGVKNGTVIVRAEAIDGSGVVSNELIIELENQCLNSIVISGEGGVNAISTKGGSLKLNGAVSPSDAGISALKWTIVSGQDLASISEDGVLTAKGINNGAVIVRAEATDGSGVVSNELSIILQNQVSSSNGGSSSGGSSSSGSSSSGGSSSNNGEEKAKTSDGTQGEENNNVQEEKTEINGWKLIDGKWYEVLSDGTYAKGWYKDVDGTWYMLDRNTGARTIGWFKDTDSSWYYLDTKSGKMLTGWFHDIDGKWYYLKDSGAMATGWVKDTDGKWYYLYADGSMAADTTIDGYYLGKSGAWIN